MDNDDIVKTVFKNHFGLFEYTMVPFGLPHTPSVFMAVMNDVLQGISFVSVYLNDILIIFTARTPHQTCHHSIRQKNVMKSFDALRSALVDAPAIMIPDFNMQFEVKYRCIRCCIECITQSASESSYL